MARFGLVSRFSDPKKPFKYPKKPPITEVMA